MVLDLAATPPMGWNSWNAFRTRIDEKKILRMADAMVDRGLLAAGYQYLVIDDGWQAPRRSHGCLTADPRRFPHGMGWLIDQIHVRGLKAGLYASPGRQTCAMIYDAYLGEDLGSFDHEQEDLNQFVEWGIDYLKYDWCEACRDQTGTTYRTAFQLMGELVAQADRRLVYSISEYGRTNPWEWAPTLATQWRTTQDIRPNFASILSIVNSQRGLEQYSGPGGWNDPDMLQVGNSGLNLAECRSQVGLWALLAAPLIMGNDLHTMSSDVAALLNNPQLIGIDQDTLAEQGRCVQREWTFQVWRRRLAEGRLAIGVLAAPESREWAFGRRSRTLHISLTDGSLTVDDGFEQRIPLDIQGPFVDVWTGEMSASAEVPKHDLALFICQQK